MSPQEVYLLQRRHFGGHPFPSISERIKRLSDLKIELIARQTDLQKALWDDFGKPSYEVDLAEIAASFFEINHAIRYLKSWVKPRRKKTPIYLIGTTTEVAFQPKGPSLIITPWNYAILLTMGPVVHATAAGSPFVIKPSELTPKTSSLIKEIIEKVYPPEEGFVFEGDQTVAKELLELPFAHIHFTGSVAVGKLIMAAGAKNLASVTLELGGKSPVYVDETADIPAAARAICFGKFSNAGQTCIAPDYVLAHASVKERLLTEMVAQIERMYGSTAEERKTSNYARIVTSRHFERLHSMLKEAEQGGGSTFFGGGVDPEERYFEPSIMVDLPKETRLLEEEIFGPILPVLSVSSEQEALKEILSRPAPLSTYVFSSKKALPERFSKLIRTGAVCSNTTLLQFIQPFGPFGGEGNSGIGRSHGEAGFRAFSNEQVVMKRKWGSWIMHPFQPPYSSRSTPLVNLLRRLG